MELLERDIMPINTKSEVSGDPREDLLRVPYTLCEKDKLGFDPGSSDNTSRQARPRQDSTRQTLFGQDKEKLAPSEATLRSMGKQSNKRLVAAWVSFLML